MEPSTKRRPHTLWSEKAMLGVRRKGIPSALPATCFFYTFLRPETNCGRKVTWL